MRVVHSVTKVFGSQLEEAYGSLLVVVVVTVFETHVVVDVGVN
jgi:hypothetical protein